MNLGLPPPQRPAPGSMQSRWLWLGRLVKRDTQKREERRRSQGLSESGDVAMERFSGTGLYVMSKMNRNAAMVRDTDGSRGHWWSGTSEAEESGTVIPNRSGTGINHEERLLSPHMDHEGEVEEGPPRYGSWLNERSR